MIRGAHKLRRLGEAMAEFRAGGFRRPVWYEPLPISGGDAIDRLGATYNAMVELIDEQLRELDRQDAARRELLGNVSHDLRTPLAALRGYLETLLLKGESLPVAERRRFLEIAARQSERLGALLADLFELARLDSRDFRIDAEPVQLTELAQDVLQTFEPAAGERGVMLRLEAAVRVPFVRADIGLIERALRSLVENALRRSRAGGSVTLAIEPRGDGVSVQVSDTGAEIAAEELPFVFDRFHRLDKSRNNPCEGTGLALAIVKRILDLHQAQIGLASAATTGTRFSFALPLA